MKAVRYRSYGDSGVLVYEDADRPLVLDRVVDELGREQLPDLLRFRERTAVGAVE